MPSILYGGVRYSQVRHAIYCKKCSTTIESKSQHDFKWCPCNSVAVDGGIGAGNRILGNLSDMESRSVYCVSINRKKLWLPDEVVQTKFNELKLATSVTATSVTVTSVTGLPVLTATTTD